MKKNLGFVFATTLIFLNLHTAFALTGNILPTSGVHSAQSLVCKDSSCTVGSAGKMNWKPAIVAGITAVSIDDSAGLSGNVWGNQLGWINLKPTGQGVTVNMTSGVLTGYAWSSTCGWMNFAPTSYGVSIVTETPESGAAGTGVGKLAGFAWCGGEGGGWIKFDCTTADACVKTNWVKIADRYVPVTPPSGGGGGGGGGGGSIVTPATTTPVVNNTFQSQTGPQNQTNGDYTSIYRSDIDDKGTVNILDFNLLMVNWAKKVSIDLSIPKVDRCKLANIADLNCDTTVNVLDFNLLMVHWGKAVEIRK